MRVPRSQVQPGKPGLRGGPVGQAAATRGRRAGQRGAVQGIVLAKRWLAGRQSRRPTAESQDPMFEGELCMGEGELWQVT